MSSHELAWAAGFFDGEGHTRGKPKNRNSPLGRSELQVGQKHIECLERLQKAVGNLGTIGGPYHRKNPVFFWYLTRTTEVDKVLTALWPYLSVHKKTQAEKAGFKFGFIRQSKTGRPPNYKKTIPTCGHPNRVHVAFGKCGVCYHADRYKELHEK